MNVMRPDHDRLLAKYEEKTRKGYPLGEVKQDLLDLGYTEAEAAEFMTKLGATINHKVSRKEESLHATAALMLIAGGIVLFSLGLEKGYLFIVFGSVWWTVDFFMKRRTRTLNQSVTYYHGTKVNLKEGDLIEPGFNSNYSTRKKASYVYLTATLDAAIWGAELAQGDGARRIYIVEPTDAIEDDPNLTDKKFPGNPTRSYRTKDPIRVIGEVWEWQAHSPEQFKAMKDHLQRLKEQGVEAIED